MTPEQINRLMAEKVMEYEVKGPYSLWYFDPYHRIEHAMMALEKLQNKYHWVIKSPFEEGDTYMAGLTPLGVTGWNGRPDFIGQADTLTAAICLACIEAKKLEVSDEPILHHNSDH